MRQAVAELDNNGDGGAHRQRSTVYARSIYIYIHMYKHIYIYIYTSLSLCLGLRHRGEVLGLRLLGGLGARVGCQQGIGSFWPLWLVDSCELPIGPHSHIKDGTWDSIQGLYSSLVSRPSIRSMSFELTRNAVAHVSSVWSSGFTLSGSPRRGF